MDREIAPKLLSAAATFPQTKRALSGDRAMPKREELNDYKYACWYIVRRRGELFIKPCTQSEIQFYESAHTLHPDFADLMPLYYGSLSLTETTTDEMIHAQIPGIVAKADVPEAAKKDVQAHLHLDQRATLVSPAPGAAPELHRTVTDPGNGGDWVPNKSRKITTDKAVVLHNSSFGYKKANIMDAKLGYDLAAPDAPQAKKDRFREIAEATTHKNYGFRVAGMRVYQGTPYLPKESGGDGEDGEVVKQDDEGFKIYDKYWGRDTVKDNNVQEMLWKNFFFIESAGIDEELARIVVQAFLADLEMVEEVLMANESRMYSASLLFVFEGDGEALRVAMEEKTALAQKREEEREARSNARSSVLDKVTESGPCANLRIDSGIGMDEDGNAVFNSTIADLVYEDGSDYSDEEDFSTEPYIYSLKLIDFAHAKWHPGQGPDENVLQGVRGLIKLLKRMLD
ncbi:inositol polyphosphate kinase-domain-containing protein [Truncatella angustata]|uniref:Kinase n=1 Tax=Truncatella angustata TaxID=152316 RepID=A0A9P9A294_9PEZI|nr:inositol polyphosphate kinase-domain-containing protein [Truncatella angustata]KAH6658908.1 inositol polyphosphate kinase-domain-containing protein [Truncatella angustata]